MKTRPVAFLAPIFLLLLLTSLNAQNSGHEDDMQNCPMHNQHMSADSHHAMVEKHGDQAMGFPHDKTTHHFLMAEDGGAIEATANTSTDKANMGLIRSHLSHLAVMFGNGDFTTPMLVHDTVPPGVTTMKLLKDKIRYEYEQTNAGGRVRIQSSDPVALAAIHDFLRFQITDHETGDSLKVESAH